MRGSDGGGSYLQLAVRADLTERRRLRRDANSKLAVWPSADREYQAEKSKQHWPWKNEAGGLPERRGPLTPKSNSFFPVSTRSADALTFYSVSPPPEVPPPLVSIHHTLGSSMPTAPSDFFTGSVSPRPTHFLWFPLNISPLNSRHSSHSVFTLSSKFPKSETKLIHYYIYSYSLM